MEKTIRDLSLGDYAIFDGDILQVEECVHGSKYYVSVCDVREKTRFIGSIEPEVVSDGDEDHLMYCC